MRERKFTRAFSVVCTATQDNLLMEEERRRGVSKADVVRDALDAYYGLVSGEFGPNDSRRTAPGA